MPTRVLLVDDSPFILDELARILKDAGGFEIAGRAAHGVAALELFSARRPDLVSLDVQMPVMNGLQTLRHLMTRVPVPVVMVSALTAEDSPLTFESLRLGAVDFVEKPGGDRPGSLSEQRQLIVERFRRAAAVEQRRIRFCALRRPPLHGSRRERSQPACLIAASAGRAGLSPVLRFLNGFPYGLGAAMIFAFDLRGGAIESLAKYLEKFSALKLVAPEGSVKVEAGSVYLVSSLSPSLLIEDRGEIWLQRFPPPARSSRERFVEMLFTSCAELFRERTIGVLFSGASAGAAYGVEKIASRKGKVLCQSPESALEPAVLQRVLDRGLADRTADPEALFDSAVTSVLQVA
ncbi:MAG: chemotaxis protein CheB [Acidobacteria bacterium]|nr:chemotaxis protein CheB [Acidobacteriota bacterium]